MELNIESIKASKTAAENEIALFELSLTRFQ